MKKASAELSNLTSNLKEYLPFANSHMVNFITHNMFERHVPKCIQKEIMALNINDLNQIVLDSFSNIKLSCEKAPNLTEFLYQTHKLSLKQNDICLPFQKLCETLGSKGCSDCSFHIIKNAMSEKKSHEVEIMSGVTAAIAKTVNCAHVVDIGGGKGYLSSVLSLKYNLKVLSIDSSFITSKGAAERIPKFEKLWNVQRKKIFNPDEAADTVDKNSRDNQRLSQLCKLATVFITEETDVVKLIRECFQEDEIGKIMLVGLHTCGNLGASSLRLFANNPEHISCLVNVGCCYHLIEEEFDTTPPWLDLVSEASGVGFPMSSYLQDIKFVLGRNARMLAAQPPDRILHQGTCQTEILFYRALLESYLERKLQPVDGMPHLRVGKLGRKCASFVEYVHKSIKRLKLEIQVDDEELRQLYDSHADSRKQLHAYFLLRLAMAPAIEAVIMIDRLLYLHEKGVEDAYLTQLFDPVVSPRCYAIIAFNKSPTDEGGV